MKRNFPLVALTFIAVTSLVFAQDHPRVSPHETVKANVGGDDISITYGRPHTKDPKSGEARKIWGTLVPLGKVWRMGADEATLLTTQKALTFGSTKVPAGTYSLYMLPEENGAKLIVNKQTGQWGTKYDESQDLARIDMQKSTAEQAADQFTIAIEDRKGGGVLKATWENTQYSAPFTVAD
ncbi:MAG TPA: DUF2911 domain-containing protein [Chthoniobacterales bacterium]